MTSTRRRAALGAIGATVLLLAATACASESDDTADSLPAAAPAETTIGATAAPGTESPTEASTAPAEPTTAPAPTDAPTPTEAPVVVPEALQFTAPLVGGGTFDGAAAAGKPTVFWFWAPT